MSSVKKKTIADLPYDDHITYIRNSEYDTRHAEEARLVRRHVEQTGSSIYTSRVEELMGSDLTPSSWMHVDPPPCMGGRINRYFSNALCPIHKSPEEIEKIIASHADEQSPMQRFGKTWTELSQLLLETRARLLAITPE